jgi:hypothetical protein
MKLLSVDFDYFFPTPQPGSGDWELFDWGMAENELFRVYLWGVRAASFFYAKRALPGLSGEERLFWRHFNFRRGASLYLADSHAMIVDRAVQQGIDEIWSFDAHHDAGYNAAATQRCLNEGEVTCENWALSLALGLGPVHVRYPRWMTPDREEEPHVLFRASGGERATYNPREPLPVFDRVFLCRSGSWVPSWLDAEFLAFAERSRLRTVWLDNRDGGVEPRPWDEDAARADAAKMEELAAQAGLPSPRPAPSDLGVVAGDDA